ncbi:glycerate kinase [Serinibacter arcticus]|uniref:Glycerate kinase n=1 Tax=Serinibacter arcticus TaxID=1655435 RepID=A0A2U1ZW66_9MICO|nr:glycerate kinase [Serinibacter arcticus]PWD51183.1 glycerate kinase [Serinibacter arcticus]
MPNDELSGRGVRIAIVPDSFKGSLSALEVATAMARGVQQASRAGDLDIRLSPLADGGEGTLDALLDAWGERARTVRTTDALGRPATARFGLSPSGTGVIEAAEANGLPQVSDTELLPLTACSRGVGTIAATLIEQGATEIILCIGGSATTDGGIGLLSALGARFLDADGEPLPPGGGALASLERIDLGGLDPRARAVTWRVACDVTNPLVGPHGAAAIFGPQKGATADDVAVLDAGLARLADVVARETGQDLRDRPGMGAAGGIALTLQAFLGAELVAGSALVAQTLGLREILDGVDLVLTGEGRFDEQSLHGKVVDAVAAHAPAGVPVVVIAGEVMVSPEDMWAHGVTTALAAARGPRTLADLTRTTADDITYSAAVITRLLGL